MKDIIKKINDFFNSIFGKIDDKTKRYFMLGGIIFLVFIIIIVIIVKLQPKYITYYELEDQLTIATKNYVSVHPEKLPIKIDKTTTVKSSTLEKEDISNDEKPYIKNIQELVNDNTCIGYVEVTKISKKEYKYQPYVECKSFKTEFLADKIIAKNIIKKEGSFNSGLYKINNELLFRGDVKINNFIKLNNKLFRIYKFDKNNDMFLILYTYDEDNSYVWDDRYNLEEDSNHGINEYTKSRIYNELQKIYEKDFIDYKNKKYFLKFDICNDKLSLENFKRDFNYKCQNILKNQKISLLPVTDYLNTSLDTTCSKITDEQCQNYNYLVEEDTRWWLLNANNDNTYQTFEVSGRGLIEQTSASDTASIKYIIKLSHEALYKAGKGTEKDPYIIR